MKRANGTGCIQNVKGRRKPYRVTVPIGKTIDEKTGKVKIKRKTIGTFETKYDAEMALNKYFAYEQRLSDPTITFEEVCEEWKKRHYVGLSEKTIELYEHSVELCWQLNKMKMKDIRPAILQDIIDSSGKNYPTLQFMKKVIRMIFRFAYDNDMILKDYSRSLDISHYKDKNPNKQKKRRLTNEEISRLWENCTNKYEHIFLILIYTGVRVNELLRLRKKDVDMEKHTFKIVKSKTENGIRTVPIADKIYPLFEEWMNNCPEGEYVFADSKLIYITYDRYCYHYFRKIKEKHEIDNFTLHCCRHTFISMMTEKGINPTIIKKIVGHASKMSLTEKVYTHFDDQELLNAVNQL